MGELTPKYGFYLPGGGSSGLITPPEQIDIDKINDNFRTVDGALGVAFVTSTTRPASPKDGTVIRETDTGNLLVWQASSSHWLPVGVPTVSSDAVRDYFFPSPQQGAQCFRSDKGWTEQYFNVHSSSNPAGATTAGWFPAFGQMPYAELTAASGSAVWNESALGTTVTPYTEVSDDQGWHNPSSNPTQIKPTIAGRYRVTLSMRFQNAGAPNEKFIKAIPNGDASNAWQVSTTDALGLPGNTGSHVMLFNGSSDYIVVNAYCSGQTTSAAFKVLLEYIGPSK